MASAFYQVTDNVRAVADGEALPLGPHVLQFVHTPFVHWPETMMTYETTQRVLFSCDGFGGYGALQGGIFDDQYADISFYEREALRYYVNIVAVFSRSVLRALEKLSGIPVDVVAPSHGLIWRKRPDRIIELYRRWAGYATGEREPGLTLLYGSMYGNTEKMMNAVAQGASKVGIPVEIYDVARTHVSYILPALWLYRGVIVGAPTYEGGLFPPIAHALDVAVRKKVQNRKAAYFGSYGWGGGAEQEFRRLAETMKWEILEAFTFRERPDGGGPPTGRGIWGNGLPAQWRAGRKTGRRPLGRRPAFIPPSHSDDAAGRPAAAGRSPAGGSVPPRLYQKGPSLLGRTSGRSHPQTRQEQFVRRNLRRAQNQPEVVQPLGELHNLLRSASVEHVHRDWGLGRNAVEDPPLHPTPYRQHTDLNRYPPVLPLVANDLLRRLGDGEAAGQGVIPQHHIVDQAVDGNARRLKVRPDEGAKGRDVRLHHLASHDKAAGRCPQHMSNPQICGPSAEVFYGHPLPVPLIGNSAGRAKKRRLFFIAAAKPPQ